MAVLPSPFNPSPFLTSRPTLIYIWINQLWAYPRKSPTSITNSKQSTQRSSSALSSSRRNAGRPRSCWSTLNLWRDSVVAGRCLEECWLSTPSRRPSSHSRTQFLCWSRPWRHWMRRWRRDRKRHMKSSWSTVSTPISESRSDDPYICIIQPLLSTSPGLPFCKGNINNHSSAIEESHQIDVVHQLVEVRPHLQLESSAVRRDFDWMLQFLHFSQVDVVRVGSPILLILQ